jgi:hypothetical protein
MMLIYQQIMLYIYIVDNYERSCLVYRLIDIRRVDTSSVIMKEVWGMLSFFLSYKLNKDLV